MIKTLWIKLIRGNAAEVLFKYFAMSCAALGIGIVGFVICYSIYFGYDRLSFNFLMEPSRSGGVEGGILYQLLGSSLLIATAAVVATPFACAIAIVEATTKSNKLKSALRSFMHLLNSTPSILFGILGFIFFVKLCGWNKSWLGGGFILALMILPTVTLALINRISTLPKGYTETARSLGLSEDQLISSIYLPYGYGGLLTGLVMGLARAAGETAPIMFTAVVFAGATIPTGIKDNPVLALPYHIFNLAQDVLADSAISGAWASASVLFGFVLFLSLFIAPFRSRSHEEARTK
jgi:phosphate transport system permease protein